MFEAVWYAILIVVNSIILARTAVALVDQPVTIAVVFAFVGDHVIVAI